MPLFKAISTSTGIAIFMAAIMPAQILAQTPDESLTRYAVNINQTPKQSWPGYGIYLGKGFVITAAHVVGHASLTKPTVIIAGQEFPAKVIKEGSFDTIDLTLLSLEEERLPVWLRLRRNPLCTTEVFVGEPVIVAVPEGIARSRIVSPRLLTPNLRAKFTTLVGDVARTGNSGSGVFDARNKCLLGIMSRKIQGIRSTETNGETVNETIDLAKYFVPASTIATFIPTELHL